MFVKVFGFMDSDIVAPSYLRSALNDNSNNSCSDDEMNDCVTLALVRWLSPHSDALLRDSDLRPVCPSPFDVNHALWTFSKIRRRRDVFERRNITRQLNLFAGKDDGERREQAERLSRAWYDLIQVDTIEKYMNCTCIDNNSELILQTITIPFE